MKARVLFVDDEQSVLDSLSRSLRHEFNVDVALGGAKGLETIRSNGPYAVVVSDLRMPGMDGIQFLTQVREICPQTARIMLTGVWDHPSAIHAVNHGVISYFLAKPCSPSILSSLLNLVVSTSTG
jgi:DNA-binding NtrC family response regulator